MDLPRIDVRPLLDDPTSTTSSAVAAELDAACRAIGFFTIVDPELTDSLLPELDEQARRFFALPAETKAEIAMPRAGAAGEDGSRSTANSPQVGPTTRKAFTSDNRTAPITRGLSPASRCTAPTCFRTNRRSRPCGRGVDGAGDDGGFGRHAGAGHRSRTGTRLVRPPSRERPDRPVPNLSLPARIRRRVGASAPTPTTDSSRCSPRTPAAASRFANRIPTAGFRFRAIRR